MACQNHEQSKKHLDAVAALRRQLEREERAAKGATKASAAAVAVAGADGDGDSDAADDVFVDASEATAASPPKRAMSKAQKKRAAKLTRRFGAAAAAAAAETDDDAISDGDLADELQAKARVNGSHDAVHTAVGEDDGSDACVAANDADIQNSDVADSAEEDQEAGSEDDRSDADHASSATDPQQQGERGGAAASTAARKPRRNKNKKADAAAASAAAAGDAGKDTTCELCGAQHESRSALFRHLKAEHRLRSKK